MPEPVNRPVGDADINRIVLAYSGGLDTSVILKWLQQTYSCEVVTFTADLGQGEELEPARQKAVMAGVKPEHIFIEDLREEFVRDYVFPMMRSNALYEGLYLLGTSIARPLIAKRQIEIAAQVGKCRRGQPRRDRQGQRPGPLRTGLLRAQSRHQGHRAVARMGSDQPYPSDRIRRASIRSRWLEGQARRSTVLDRCEHAAYVLGRAGAGGPVERGPGLRLFAHRQSGRRAGTTPEYHHRSISNAATASR